MRVAIVADWLVGGGAEKVVEQLHKVYPKAPIYTSYTTDEWRKRLGHKVVTGPLQKWPFSKLRKYLPILRIWWFTSLKFDKYDLVISVSGNGESKGIKTSPSTLHISYCNTPTHFYWRHHEKYLANPGFGIFSPLARLGLKLLVRPLRSWDYKAAQRPDFLLANSTFIQSEIKHFYNRDSVVVYPPVDTERFGKWKMENGKMAKRRGFITAGRLVPHKNVDVIVRACSQLNLPLKVVGTGPELANLKRLAGPSVEFLGFVPDSELSNLFADAEAFLFASFEDFGIMPVEALATGTPVIAYKAGGALDYIIPGKSGDFFNEQTVESLTATLKKFQPNSYNPKDTRAVAQKFSIKNFQNNIVTSINKIIKNIKT